MLMSFMWQLKHLEMSLLGPSSYSCLLVLSVCSSKASFSQCVCAVDSTGDPDDNRDVLNIAWNKGKKF